MAGSSRLDLDADTDRSGRIDGNEAEERLEDVQSVIVLNNCDDDNLDGQPDHVDDRIDGPADGQDVEPIIIRRSRIAQTQPVRLVIANLTEDDLRPEQKVRVFDNRGREVLGPEAGSRYTLPRSLVSQLEAGDLRFAVEGLLFGTSVQLQLVVGGIVHDSLHVEVAPFLLTPHDLQPRNTQVCRLADYPESDKYVAAFAKYCGTAAVTLAEIRDNGGDPWVEDEVSWGVTSTPRTSMPVALHMLRQRGLEFHVEKLVAPNVGYFKAFDYDSAFGSSLDYGGNLEVTPPTKQYPFGRVYYGSIRSEGVEYFQRAIDPAFQTFFKRQMLQPPIDLNSDWLGVGHVDEVVTFVPKKNSDSFIMLLASPKLALEILRRLGSSAELDDHYQDYGVHTVRDLMNKRYLMRSFADFNMDVDAKIFGDDRSAPSPESIKGTLMRALNLSEADVREVPVLFENSGSDNSWDAVALTPGLVNLSSLGQYCIVPDPFIPEFRQSFSAAISDVGQTPLWIDDWEIYHRGAGEVHCGSNETRVGFGKQWWKHPVSKHMSSQE